jgi:predicted acyltransferase
MKTVPLKSDTHHRLYSLDALRGFDMFWITGGGVLAVIISQLTGWTWLGEQMDHVKWDGFHFYDLIFPLFMFISGVAIPYAVESKLEKNVPARRLVRKVLIRFVILVLLGILYNGALERGFSEARYASVLGQIGFGYFFASLIVIFVRSSRIRLVWLGGILLFVSLMQLLFPVPVAGAGVLTPEGCVNGYFDRLILPGKLYGGVFDPEGLLCNVSAIAITLLGSFAGNILRQKHNNDWRKIAWLSGTGASLIILALILNNWYPIIKSCWTTTFNLLAGGISFLLIALFFLIIDHWKFRKWAFYFRVIGMNSIFVYLLERIVNIERISKFFTGWLANMVGELAGQLVICLGALAITWLVLYFLYKKEVFVRI